MATCYETLGIDPQATSDQIDQAYRFLAQKFHPDANPGSGDMARKRFQVVQEAYDILSDPKRRREYDVKLGAGIGSEWERITMNTDNGGVRFNSDGSLDVAGRHIDSGEGVPRCTIGAATLEKDAGPSGEFRIWHHGKSHRFRYSHQAWYANREKPAASRSAPPPPPSNTLAAPGDRSRQPRANVSEPITYSAPRQFSRNMLLAGGLLLAGVAGGFYVSRSASPPLALTPEEEILQKGLDLEKRQQLADLNAKLHAQAAIEERQRQEIALTKDGLLQAKRKGEAGLISVSELMSQLDQWDSHIVPLLTNEEGRKLAATEDNLRVFKSLYAKRRVTKIDAAALRTEIETLLAPINQALASDAPGHGAGEDFNKRMEAKHAEAEKSAIEVRSAREAIRNLVALAASSAPSAKTLEQALADISLRDTQQEAALIARTEKESRDASSAEMVKARQTLLEAQAEKERLAVERQASAVRDKIQHDKDLEEAQTPAVQEAIRFFTTAGYYQPDAQSSYIKTVEPRPISYSRLVAKGALEPTNHGLGQLLFIATRYPSDLRPTWSMANEVMNLTPAQSKKLADTQGYLRRFGPVLVELKLLDP